MRVSVRGSTSERQRQPWIVTLRRLVEAQVGAVQSRQQAQLAARRRQVRGGLLQRVEVAEARDAVADQERAADLLVGERAEALAAVLDRTR